MPKTDTFRYHGLIIRVAVPSPLRRLFDYLPPNIAGDIQPGMRVRIPFGRRDIVGVVMELANGSELERSRLKAVKAVLDTEPLYSTGLLNVLCWAIRYYHHPAGEVLSTALPVRLRQGEPLRRIEQVWQVSPELPAPIDAALGRAPKQLALLRAVQEAGMLSSQQMKALGFSTAVRRQLEQKNLLQQTELSQDARESFAADGGDPSLNHDLNEDQRNAVQAIRADLDTFSCFVLDGVTGSGKTEVYIQVMSAVLAAGRQCLVLIPEIGLTPQTIKRFAQRFSCPIAALHSGLNDTERLEAWRQANDGSAGIVIGTRSAVFSNLAKPGLIIVDEEHDSSFKQQDGFRYSARDLAVMRGHEEHIPVVLGSATPSLETLFNIERGRYQHLRLRERAGDAVPSNMELVDVANQTLENGFHEIVLLRIRKHLERGNQALVFINRRGFAPLLHCLTCGWVAECEACMAQYTVHSKPATLRCHHCGAREDVPRACPSCAGRQLSTVGLGTQQLETQLERLYPEFPVIRIDRDSTRSRKRFSEMLSQVESGEPCLLLGTQMLAKGHHFPAITLVVVVDADSGLFSADFRGQEHMAQTIVQVAGRAGRAEQSGEVLVQSRHASHETLQALSKLDYSEFAQRLLVDRRNSQMPPYSHLALLRCESRSTGKGLEFLQQVLDIALECVRQQKLTVDCLGPLPAPMEKRAGRFRSQLLLQASDRADLQNLLVRMVARMEAIRPPAGLRWSLDIDPQDMI